MRITSNMMRREGLANLQSDLRQIYSAQSQVSSGLRVQKPSDDPVAAAGIVRTSGSLRALDQYKQNITQASSRMDAEEQALDSLTDLLARAKDLAVTQDTDTATAQTRQAVKSEVDQLLDQAVSLGNTQLNGEYLFGGVRTDVAPFDATVPGFAATPPTGDRKVEISQSVTLSTTHDGSQVFLNTGALAALKQLSDALAGDDRQAIGDATNALDSAFEGVQALLAETGARSNQLQVTQANLSALASNLTSFKSNLQDVDMEKAITDLVGRQTAYQAAMAATSRVMGMTLTDYLK